MTNYSRSVLLSNGLHHSENLPVKFGFSPKIVPANIVQKLPSQRCSKPLFIAFFNFSHKRPTFAFTGESGYTLGSRRKIAHSGTHGETGAFRTGPLSLPSTRTARSRTSPGRVSERRTLPLLGLGHGCSQRTQRAFGTAMRLCASLSRRRRSPAGLRDLFSLLSKLRLVRPVPETSFGFPDAPACAVPVQAASQFVPFRLGAGQGFSVETGRIFCYNF